MCIYTYIYIYTHIHTHVLYSSALLHANACCTEPVAIAATLANHFLFFWNVILAYCALL